MQEDKQRVARQSMQRALICARQEEVDSDGAPVFETRSRVRAEGQSTQFARLMRGRKVLTAERLQLEKANTAVLKHARIKQEDKQKLRDIVEDELRTAALDV
eukprot:4060610-Pleurochrysis_carterae.AAC.2